MNTHTCTKITVNPVVQLINSHTHTHTLSDEDFEVTAEMLIHDDVDDESTLDEEEALQEEEQDDQEISDLQKVGLGLSLSLSLPPFTKSCTFDDPYHVLDV